MCTKTDNIYIKHHNNTIDKYAISNNYNFNNNSRYNTNNNRTCGIKNNVNFKHYETIFQLSADEMTASLPTANTKKTSKATTTTTTTAQPINEINNNAILHGNSLCCYQITTTTTRKTKSPFNGTLSAFEKLNKNNHYLINNNNNNNNNCSQSSLFCHMITIPPAVFKKCHYLLRVPLKLSLRHLVLVLLFLLLLSNIKLTRAAPQSCIYCREEDLRKQDLKQNNHNYEEFLFEHQVTRQDAINALKALNESFYSGGSVDRSCKTVTCTKQVMKYCLGPLFINDHCWCEMGHVQEGLPFVPHICYVGEKTYTASVGSCFFYEEVKECCCAAALANQWRHISGSATSLLPSIFTLTTFVFILIWS